MGSIEKTAKATTPQIMKILVIGDNQVLLTIMNARKLALIDFITSQVM